ncbi:endonuclease domain-containing protein [Erythrobacter sp. HA6-11]
MLRKSDHNYAAARRLRKTMSLPEGLLWRELRARKSGLKFRRQHPVGRYVLDFYCAAAKLGIEIDGIAHDMGDRRKYDTRRDAWLTSKGISVLRIAASDVLRDPNECAEAIANYCKGKA